MQWVRNNIDDLVDLDDEGNRTESPFSVLEDMVIEILNNMFKSDEQRIKEKYTNHDIPLS